MHYTIQLSLGCIGSVRSGWGIRPRSVCATGASWLQMPAMIIVIFSCSGCGSGSEGETGTNEEPQQVGFGWVTIDSGTQTSGIAFLAGTAFISPNVRRCCSEEINDPGVAMSWINFTTQGGGRVSQTTRHCSTGYFDAVELCEHAWSASVRLAIGVNKIAVTASDDAENIGRKSITVARPPEVP